MKVKDVIKILRYFRIKNLEKWDKILKDAKIWIYSLKFKIIFFILHRISPNIILYNIKNIIIFIKKSIFKNQKISHTHILHILFSLFSYIEQLVRQLTCIQSSAGTQNSTYIRAYLTIYFKNQWSSKISEERTLRR